MTVSIYRPTTLTENAQTIIRTSTALWDLYKEANRLLNYGTVIITDGEVTDQALLTAWLAGGNTPNWQALADNFGLDSADKATAMFMDMAQGFGQINAEEINEQPNHLRLFMHRVG